MKWRLLAWLTTAAVLVAATVVLPRLAPLSDHDPFPTSATIGSASQVRDGSLLVTSVRAAPRWTRADESYSLAEQDGLFVEVRAMASPDRTASTLRAAIVSDGRTFRQSDRASPYNPPAAPGFDTQQVIVFEVPDEALADAAVLLNFVEDSEARLPLTGSTVEFVDVLEGVE